MQTYKNFYDYDLFGYNVGLYFNGNIKEGTLIGIITTIIYALSFICVTIYYISETFSRKNYTFSTSTIKYENTTTIKLDKEIFALSFGMQHPITYAEYVDETIYNIKASLMTGKRDPVTQDFSWYTEEIKTGPCSLDMFSKENQHFFQDGYKNKYCLYDMDKRNLTGHFVFDQYSQILISFYPCVNNTENNYHCKPKKIIDYYLNNTYFGLFLQSITIDENLIPMTRTYIEDLYSTACKDSFKDYQVFLKIVETEDDTGIITNSRKYRKLLQFDYTKDMFVLNRKVYDDNSYLDITIKLSDKKTAYKRTFEKINTSFSKAGSMMTLICSFIQFCCWLPVKTFYEVSVINKIFRFDLTKNKKLNGSNISRYMSSSENYIKNSKSNNNNELNNNVMKNENEDNIKDINKDNTNLVFMHSKNKSSSNLNNLNSKSNNHIEDLNIKFMESNNGNKILNKIQRRSIINKMPNIYREGSGNIKNKLRESRSIDNEKYIVDVLKFNWCQLLCYHPIKYYSNNIKVNLARNAQKFFRKTMDVISVFRNVVTSQKIFQLILKNQRIFGIYGKDIYNYNKPIISNDRIESNNSSSYFNI